MKLTKAVVDRAKYEGKQTGSAWSRDVRWDSTLTGFGLRIFPSGVKAFVISYRSNGQSRLMTIGRFGVLTVDQARDACVDILSKVNQERDPLLERKEKRRAATIGELCIKFIEEYAKHNKSSWLEDERRMKRCIPASWAQRKVDSITSNDIERLKQKIAQRSKVEANRTLALISKMYNYEGLDNPTKGIQRCEEVERERWLLPEEIIRLKDAINDEPNIYVRAALWLYLLTGVRKTELLTAKWSDINSDHQALLLKKTKSGKPHKVPLSSFAMTILDHLPRQKGNPYILPGGKVGHHLVNIYKPWYRILKQAKVQDCRIHDLRRSFGSMIVQSGQSLQLISKLLNHSNTRTSEIYARLSDQQPRDAMEKHGEAIRQLVGEIEI